MSSDERDVEYDEAVLQRVLDEPDQCDMEMDYEDVTTKSVSRFAFASARNPRKVVANDLQNPTSWNVILEKGEV